MRYQFQSQHGNIPYRPKLFTDAIRTLIGINAVMYALTLISRQQIDLTQIFGLSPSTVWPLIWQPITYMFIHGSFFHILINMFVLWMFGSEMETIWGRQAFLKYYFITGVGSGLVWLVFNLGNPYTVLIGASGAIYGILLAYGLMFPNREILLYFLFPIKVKYFVILLGALAFFSSMNTVGSNISHLTHLSGMVIGYLYLKYPWKWKHLKIWFLNRQADLLQRREVKKQQQKSTLQQEVDRLLDKINDVGYDGLTEAEKRTLYQASKYLSQKQEKD